jgi:hypothetical protein
MRSMVLNATVLTSLTHMPSNAQNSQQADVGGKLRTESTGIDAHLESEDTLKMSEFENVR